MKKGEAQESHSEASPSTDSAKPLSRFRRYSSNVLRWLGSFVGVLGISSVAAAFTVWLALVNLPPEISVEAVVDRSPTLPAESRIRIKNIGVLPALNIRGKAFVGHAVFGTNILDGFELARVAEIPRLAAGESTEISVDPSRGNIKVIPAEEQPLRELSYSLDLQYTAKAWFYEWPLRKNWGVELRKFSDGYGWDVWIQVPLAPEEQVSPSDPKQSD